MNNTATDQTIQNALRRHQGGDFAAAESIYRQVLRECPNHPDALHLLGVICAQTGRVDEAIDWYSRTLAVAPDAAACYCNLGIALRETGRIDAAITALARAVQLQPDLAVAHNNLATALQLQGRFDEMVMACERAISLQPGLASAHNNLGTALSNQRRFREAIAAFEQAIHLMPELPEAHYNLANALRDLSEFDRAIAAFHAALRICPRYADALVNLGEVLAKVGRLDEALACFRDAVRIRPNLRLARSNIAYSVHFHPDYDGRKILEENRAWAAALAAPLAGELRPHFNDRSPERRLKIGYVSPDFRMHAATSFLMPLLSHHDRQNVQVYCYANVRNPDAITQRYKELGHEWRDIDSMSEAALAQQVRNDGIDILIDLSLHMKGNKLLCFARKPAPVQVTWLGYPGTTGLSTIDYRLTDPYLDPFDGAHGRPFDGAQDRPPGEGDEPYVEKSVRLPRCFWCYQPLTEAPDVSELPALTNGQFTFGCFNNFRKVTPPTLALWLKVLQEVPRSRLMVQSPPGGHREAIRSQFAAGGVAGDRIEFVDRLGYAEYLRLFGRVDVCLDPIPCPGHTTTFDGLYMGVPSITLAGSTAISRGGVSILSNLGLKQFIAGTPDRYVAIAKGISEDLSSLGKLRLELRAMMEASPLMDAKRFAADVERAYREMWRRWCEGGG